MKADARMGFAALLIVATTILSCAHDTDDYLLYEDGSTDVLTLAVAMDTVPADGAMVVGLVAHIDPNARSGMRTIAFATSAGTIKTPQVEIDRLGNATTTLVPTLEPGIAYVDAKVGTVLVRRQVVFERAWPDTVVVDAGSFTLRAEDGAATKLSALLLHADGFASTKTEVVFTARDSLGVALGHFRDITRSDSQGRATAEFEVGTISYRGPVLIDATVLAPDGTRHGETSLRLVNP